MFKKSIKQFDPEAGNFWDVFEKAKIEQQVETVMAVLDAGKMNHDLAFEMMEQIEKSLSKNASGRAQYAELVWKIREKAPKSYQHEARYFHHNLIRFAIDDGRLGEIPSFLEIYRHEADVDAYYQVIHELVYHGLHKTLIPVMVDAIAPIEKSPDLVPWAAEEFKGEIAKLMLWEYLETSPSPGAHDDNFLTATAPYVNWKEDWLERYIPRFSSAASSAWQPSDFAPERGVDTLNLNLHNLLAEFVAEQHRLGIPYGRADMAWEGIAIALTQQNGIGQARQGKKKPAKQTIVKNFSLIPSFATLDKALTDFVPMVGGKPYHLAATVELLPAYLKFICQLNLITETERKQAFKNLAALPKNIPNVLRYYGTDQRCVANLLAAWK